MREAQSLCEVGSWCEKGVRFKCSAGRVGRTEGLLDGNCTELAPAGSYSEAGWEKVVIFTTNNTLNLRINLKYFFICLLFWPICL